MFMVRIEKEKHYYNAKHSNRDLELLKQYELINKQNRSIGFKGRPTKKKRRNLGDWLS